MNDRSGIRPDYWTPAAVLAALVEALEWHRQAGSAPGPTGFRSGLPELAMDMWDRLAEGWDSMEEEGEERRIWLAASPERVSRYEAALHWVADYLQPVDERAAKAVNVTAYAKAYRRSVRQVARERDIPRTWVTTLTDRGLAVISTKLELQREPLWWGRKD